MEKRLKVGIFRIFRSPLRSCQSQILSDVAQGPIFLHRDSCHSALQTPPSKSPHIPFICRHRSTETIKNNHRRQNKRESTRHLYHAEERKCPPPSPATPFSSCRFEETEKNQKSIKTKKKKNEKDSNRKKSRKGKEIIDLMVLSTSSGSRRFFSSDDDKEKVKKDQFFSSDSSSCSSPSSQSQKRGKIRSFAPILTTKTKKVQESVAVVKCTDDPHSDFRASMVEMIIEKQMYAAEDLEQLLECFLSLNSPYYHPVIVEVFGEILEALFPTCF